MTPTFATLKVRNILFVAMLVLSTMTMAQTTFTESAAAYGVNVGGGKDGGHAWADYDLDGDFDLFVNSNSDGYLMRNDGGSFTEVTNTLIPDANGDGLERTVLFVDLTMTDTRIYLETSTTTLRYIFRTRQPTDLVMEPGVLRPIKDSHL